MGSVVTLILLSKVQAGLHLTGLQEVRASLANAETLIHLGKEIAIGAIVGIISYMIINRYEKQKKSEKESNHDI